MKLCKATGLIMLTIIVLIVIIGCDGIKREKFKSLAMAESKIGKINTPKMLSSLEVSKVEYYNDYFTAHDIKVYYKTWDNEELIFEITSSLYWDKEFEAIESSKISDIKWIRDGENYILKWRNSNQEFYKYLITKNEDNKSLFIEVAEEY